MSSTKTTAVSTHYQRLALMLSEDIVEAGQEMAKYLDDVDKINHIGHIYLLSQYCEAVVNKPVRDVHVNERFLNRVIQYCKELVELKKYSRAGLYLDIITSIIWLCNDEWALDTSRMNKFQENIDSMLTTILDMRRGIVYLLNNKL